MNRVLSPLSLLPTARMVKLEPMTVTSQAAVTDSSSLEAAVMVTAPSVLPVTTPFSSTVATAGSEEVQTML